MRKVTKKWKMQNGTKIRICDMEDSHLLNTIKMLDKMSNIVKRKTPYPNFNGEMAQYCAEQDHDRMLEATPEYFFPIYEDLYNEAERREIL
jgi:hypothetical protein